MSTCPDTDLYSAYVDGEIPSPWKEKLEEHLASCASCREVEKRYRAMREAVQKADADTPLAGMEFLESSFRKLSPRWEIAAEKAVAERAAFRPAVSRKSVTIRYFALAAMFLVAAFVPSFFAVKTMEGRMSESPSMQTAQQNSSSSVFLSGLQSGGDYRMQQPTVGGGTLYVTAGAAQNGADFTLINRARMFSQDKEMFSSSGNGYVIIRLPEMVRFGGSGAPERERERPEMERGFSPMQPQEERHGESGYIINVSQQ